MDNERDRELNRSADAEQLSDEQRWLKEERRQAAEAVAKEIGKPYATVATDHANEVRAVVEMARERMWRRGTTFPFEAAKVARARQASRERSRAKREWEKQHLSPEFLKVRGYLRYAISRTREAYNIARDVEFTADSLPECLLEYTADILSTLRAYVNLLDRRIIGKEENVDWDAELKKLVKEQEMGGGDLTDEA